MGKLRNRPTLLSLNRFEKKKNASLAIEAFAKLRKKVEGTPHLQSMRLVIAGKPIANTLIILEPSVAVTSEHTLSLLRWL